MAKLFGSRSSIAKGAMHKHRAFSSRLQLLLAATSSLQLPRFPKLSEIVEIGQPGSDDCFFIRNGISMDSDRICYRPKLSSLPRSSFLSFIGLWVKLRHRNKSASSKSKPVQINLNWRLVLEHSMWARTGGRQGQVAGQAGSGGVAGRMVGGQ